MTDNTPSIVQLSVACVATAKEKPELSGIPVVIDNWLDWVVSVVPAIAPDVEAVTRTGVLTVPALTVATTKPCASEIPVSAANDSPPTVVLSPNVTVFPLIGLLPASTTLNVTAELGAPPLPFNAILVGLADIYCRAPTAGAVMVNTAEEVARPVPTVAVIVSVPAQPLSWYEAIATPLTVAIPVLSVALPLLAQAEEKLTCCGVVAGTPKIDTVTLTLVVPFAERAAAPTPNTGALIVTVVAPMENPVVADSAVAATCALAVMVVAPAAAIFAGEICIEATPVASVSAVPLAGVMATKVAVVVNVTTVFGTATPVASRALAFTVVGAALEIEVTATPAALLRLRVIVGAAAAGAAAPGATAPGAAVAGAAVAFGSLPPPPQAVNNEMDAASSIHIENLIVLLPPSNFKTLTPLSRHTVRHTATIQLFIQNVS